MSTTAQVRAAVSVVMVLAECIREVGEIPSGVLYSHVLGRMTLDQHQSAIGVLKRAGLVEESVLHVLKWTGPKIEATP